MPMADLLWLGSIAGLFGAVLAWVRLCDWA